jgi:hypothetical protein
MRMTVLMVTLGVAFLPATASAKDCTLSKEFYLKRPQVLKGVLEDPATAILPSVKLELLSGKTVIKYTVTDENGQYSFGETSAGRYRLRAVYNQESFCAPIIKCGERGCSIQPRVRLNPKIKPVIVY